MTEKVLFVDDDPNLLAACERNFRRKFQVETAEGGEVALKKIAEHGPFAVVISDRQMPGMDGIQFLTRVRERAPDTVRIMLTGNANLEGAIQVVNEGNIFRFLTKPCPQEVLGKAVADGLAQFKLVTAEKELLSQTLGGSIKLLTDILTMMDPGSFGRAQSMREVITALTRKFKPENDWEIHLALMLAPISCMTVPAETLRRARAGLPVTSEEQQILAQMPETAGRLLANIPRLEGVGRVLRYHRKQFDGGGLPDDAVKGDALPFGSRLLKILGDLTDLQAVGAARAEALEGMQLRTGWYDPQLLDAVREHYGLAGDGDNEDRPRIVIGIEDLAVGMIPCANIETQDGSVISPRGQHITEMTLEKIKNFERLSNIKEPIYVTAP